MQGSHVGLSRVVHASALRVHHSCMNLILLSCHASMIHTTHLYYCRNIIGLPLPTEADSESTRASYSTLARLMTATPIPSDTDLRELIDTVHSLGALVSVNHIPWSTAVEPAWGKTAPTLLPGHPTRSQLAEWGVDFIEVVNGETLDLASIQFIERQPSSPSRMGMLSGTDLHYPVLPHAWTILKSSVSPPTADSIMDQLRQRATSFLFDAGTSSISEVLASEDAWGTAAALEKGKARYEVVVPWGALGEYVGMFYEFKGSMWSFQVLLRGRGARMYPALLYFARTRLHATYDCTPPRIQGTFCGPSSLTLRWRVVLMFAVYAVTVFIGVEVVCYVLSVYVVPALRAVWKRWWRGRSGAVSASGRVATPV